MKPLLMLTADQKVAEIKRLYYGTSRPTIVGDLARAIDLLKSMASEEERERVAVYMDGLSQMRSDWARKSGQGRGGKRTRTIRKRRTKNDKRRTNTENN
jgi:hypothetical protein